ncbi:hypothetical protein EDB84DRAFT_1447186, partial [Lactarius hengduanensis]
MADDHEVDWGNDEDDSVPSKPLLGSIGMSHATGGGDEEEEFAAYGARANEQNTPPTDKLQTIPPKIDVSRRSVVSVSKKAAGQGKQIPLPPSPQPEISQLAPKLTHALPPKPVVASSFRVPPSTTAASPMSLPRKGRSNGNVVNTSDEPLPSDRETKNSRNVGRHHESHPDESSWTRPGSKIAAHLHGVVMTAIVLLTVKLRYSSDEEGRESSLHLAQSRNDTGYRHDDRDKRHNYPSGDRNDKPTPRIARLSPEDEPSIACALATGSLMIRTLVASILVTMTSHLSETTALAVFQEGMNILYMILLTKVLGIMMIHLVAVPGQQNVLDTPRPTKSLFTSPAVTVTSLQSSRRSRTHPTAPPGVPSSSRISHDRGRAESPPSRPRGPDRLDRQDACSAHPSGAPVPFLTPAIGLPLSNAERRRIVMAIHHQHRDIRATRSIYGLDVRHGPREPWMTLADRGEENLFLHKVIVTRKRHLIRATGD